MGAIQGAMLKGSTQPVSGTVEGGLSPVDGGSSGSGTDLDFVLLEAGNQNNILMEDTLALLIKENTDEGDIDG